MADQIERIKPHQPPETINPDLTRWVRGLWHTQPLLKMELHHGSANGSDHVQTWSKDKLVGKEPDTFLAEVLEEAQSDAKIFKGPQTYVVFAFIEGQQKAMRKPFRMAGMEWDDEHGGGELESEPATGKGHLAQMMRHNEAFARLAITGSRESNRMLVEMLQEMRGQNKDLLGLHFKVLETHKELQDRTFERDMEREDKMTMREIKKLVAGEAIKLFPAIMTKLTAKAGNANDEKQARDEQLKMLLMQFAGSFTTQEQMIAMLGPLDERQRMMFIEIYNTLLAEHQAEAASQAAANETANTVMGQQPQQPQQSQQQVYQAQQASSPVVTPPPAPQPPPPQTISSGDRNDAPRPPGSVVIGSVMDPNPPMPPQPEPVRIVDSPPEMISIVEPAPPEPASFEPASPEPAPPAMEVVEEISGLAMEEAHPGILSGPVAGEVEEVPGEGEVVDESPEPPPVDADDVPDGEGQG